MAIERLFDILYDQLEKAPREDAFTSKKYGKWVKTSTHAVVSQVNRLSRGLLKLGINPGDKIGIITTTNRTEWHITDYALQQIGVIGVPIYPSISVEDNIFIINNSECKFCFVSDEELYDKLLEVKKSCPSLVGLYTYDNVDQAPNWEEVIELGDNEATQHEVEAIKNNIKPDDLVTLIYTSGTTGTPKGVMLTHKNIVSNVLASEVRVPDCKDSNPRTLSFLPICHIFERMITYLYQYKGFSIYFAESIETIGDNVKDIKPHFMTVVPRLIEKVYAKIYQKGSDAGGLKSKIFHWALAMTDTFELYKPKSLKFQIADKLVFKKWREGLGGNMICLISGSAALSSDLNRKFHAAGIPILEGYGLTETSPVISVNAFGKGNVAIGSVGKVLDNLDVKIAEDGEILVKGPSVTQGYFNNEVKTKEVFNDEGYFMTGDIGEFKNGLLFITDRKKEMFKTSGGKYIAPQVIENGFKQSRFIEQIMVVGEGEKMPCAFVQPDFEFVKSWAKQKNIDLGDASCSSIANTKKVVERIEQEVQEMNQKLGHWEQIKLIKLTPCVWSIEEGHLTPTLKLKRKVIKQDFKELYDEMYVK